MTSVDPGIRGRHGAQHQIVAIPHSLQTVSLKTERFLCIKLKMIVNFTIFGSMIGERSVEIMDNLRTIQHQVSVILVSDTFSNTNIASSRVARKENTHTFAVIWNMN